MEEQLRRQSEELRVEIATGAKAAVDMTASGTCLGERVACGLCHVYIYIRMYELICARWFACTHLRASVREDLDPFHVRPKLCVCACACLVSDLGRVWCTAKCNVCGICFVLFFWCKTDEFILFLCQSRQHGQPRHPNCLSPVSCHYYFTR